MFGWREGEREREGGRGSEIAPVSRRRIVSVCPLGRSDKTCHKFEKRKIKHVLC
jgi:hypothetical protein